MTCAYARQDDLIDIFNQADRDIFTETAAEMGWERQDVKTLVYLILFAGGGKRAADAFGVSIEEGKALVEEFHRKYPGIRRISNECTKVAGALKYIQYWTGRRRHFFANGAPTYRAFNAAIQGGEAEIMKRAMIRLQREVCDENCRMVLQIHDAIAFEIAEGMEDEYLPRIKNVMESAPDAFCEKVGVNVRFAVEAKPWGAK
jgi:DNA polymerase-1